MPYFHVFLSRFVWIMFKCVFCASPGCNLRNKVRKPNIMHITISIEASLHCFCLSSKTQIYSIYTDINVLDQWLWWLTHGRDAATKEQSGCLFFFFFQLHPCCISAFFPNYTLYSDASVLNNALKSLYVHMCVCAELWKERPGALHNKRRRDYTRLTNTVWKRQKKRERQRPRWNRTVRISVSPLSTASDFWKKRAFHRPSCLIKERICSKQLYLNLSCLRLL